MESALKEHNSVQRASKHILGLLILIMIENWSKMCRKATALEKSTPFSNLPNHLRKFVGATW